MKKNFVYFLVLLMFFSACKTIKKTQPSSSTINAEKIEIENADDRERKYVLGVQQNLINNKIDFQTFSSKLSLSIESAKLNQNASGNLRIEKDKKIWMSVTGPFGIEVFRALVTPDSVMVLNKLQSKIIRRNFAYLQNVTKLPLDFFSLQDLLLGNAIFAKGDLQSFKTENNILQLLIENIAFNNLITLDNSQIKSFQISENSGNRNSNIFYENYQSINGKNIPLNKIIEASDGGEKSVLQIQYKEPIFNQNITFPFSIPKNYSEE